MNPPSVRKRRGVGRPVVARGGDPETPGRTERNRRRAGVIERAQRGWEVGGIADALKIPVGMARSWLAEWAGPAPTAEEGPPIHARRLSCANLTRGRR